MIVGTGIDIVLVSRMEKVYARHGDRLCVRILHAEEQTQCPTLEQMPRWMAKRWAVKEAAAKALGTGFQQGVKFTDFIYTHNALGKPLLVVSGAAQAHATTLNIQHWHLSVSDEKDHVIAMVIAEQ
jgi:holo-[acyl-carrier protein] synthase